MPRQYTRIPAEVRFWAKVNKDGPVPPHRPDLGACWLWAGALNKGYGTFGFPDRRKTVAAHRFAFFLASGLWPREVRHACDNPPCVNAAHLEGGTHADNMADMKMKGRARNRPLLGSSHGRARLTETDIPVIRAAVAGGASHRAVAERYNIHESTVALIVHRRRWTHVSG